jgi:hypothetical protein
MKKYLSILALIVGVSLVAALSTRAATQAEENFNYPNGTQLWGTTPGQGDGGTGWSTTWSATSAAISTNSSTGLGYGALQTSGGSVVMGNPYGPMAGSQNSQRILQNTFGTIAAANSGTIWISFLYQNWTTDNVGRLGFRQANVGFFSGASTNANGSANVNGTEVLDVGSLNTYTAGVGGDYMSLWGAGVGQAVAQQSTVATPRGAFGSGGTMLVVLRLDVDNTAAADTVFAWFNPTIGGLDPSTAIATTTNIINLSAINAFRIAAGNANASGTNAVMAIDEFRLGYTFADVTPVPEPVTFALAGLGGLMFLALRRRK